MFTHPRSRSWLYTKVKLEGNQLISEGNIERAVAKYTMGLWLAEQFQHVDPELRSILCSNRAYANIKLQPWSQVVSDCSEALSLHGQNVKALYRRAVPYHHLGEPEKAYVDAAKFVNEQPSTVIHADALDLMADVSDALPPSYFEDQQ